MQIEVTTGHDSFLARGSSPRRNVSVLCYTRIGDKIIPLFEAVQQRQPGYKGQSVVQSIPPTSLFSPSATGQWFRTRYDIAPLTEILVEYRYRASTGFSQEIIYALLVADPTTALNIIRLELTPQHEYSAVKYVFFEGRLRFITEDEELSVQSIAAWRSWFKCTEEELPRITYLFDLNNEHFSVSEVEAAATPDASQSIKINEKGKPVLKIRRTRHIKT